jgi:hypothetical protein
VYTGATPRPGGGIRTLGGIDAPIVHGTTVLPFEFVSSNLNHHT